MFTTLTNWLRPARRPERRRPLRFSGLLEALEERTVPDANYFNLAGNIASPGTFSQDWSNTGLIGTNNSWTGVPSIQGFSGAGLTGGSTALDPQNILGTGGGPIVTANQSNPNTLTPGGIAEFDGIADPVVALAGDSTNQAPNLVISVDTRGTGNVFVSYDLRDVDGSARNAISPVALQYRVGASGSFINVPGGFVGDASSGPNTTKTTSVGPIQLPAAANDQAQVQIRIITADANGADEWIGVDNIVVRGNLPPVVGVASSTLNYTENDPFTPIDPAATVADSDSGDFNTGVLTVDYTAVATADDRLRVINQGTAGGQVGFNLGTGAVTFNPGGGAVAIGTANTNGGVATTPLVITLNTNATPTAVQALLRDIGYSNVSDDPVGGIRNVRFVVTDGDGGTSVAAVRPVNVIPVNDPPVISTPTGPVGVTEGAAAVILDAAATLADPDSHDFDAGTLVVSIPSGGTANDILAVQNQGGGPGAVGVSGSNITFGGAPIGTFTGGVGAALIVAFNLASTPVSVQAVMRAVTFQNTSLNPPVTPRNVRFVATDGDGGTSNIAQVSVTIIAVNNSPVLTLSASGIAYTENDAPTILDPGVAIADPDSPTFDGGTLTVDVALNGASEDLLFVRNQGSGAGQIGASGATVSFGGTPIGSILSDGSGTTPLQIKFNANATIAAVQALARNITYFNSSNNPSTATRTVRFAVTDGAGGTSPTQTMTVAIVAVNDAPTIANVDGKTLDYEAGFPAAVLAGSAVASDPDSATLATGNLTVRIAAGGLPADVLAIRNQGAGPGKIGVNGTNVTYGGALIGTFSPTGGTNGTDLVVTFTANATPTAVTALVEQITFKTPNGVGVVGNRSVSFAATDDLGATSNLATMTVKVASSAGPNDDFYETNEDVLLAVPANGVLGNDPNPGQLVATLVSGPSSGVLNLSSNGAFTYLPALNSNGTDKFTYRWTNTVTSATGTAVVTVVVNPVNDPPTVALSAPAIAVNEDSGTTTIAGFATIGNGGGIDEAAQTRTVTVATSSASNVAGPLFVGAPALDATGKLTFTPGPNANGTATVTITVQDSGGTFGNPLDNDTTVVRFAITVNAVNDAPTFQLLGAPPTVLEDAGPQTVPGFAFNFTPGPAAATDEAGQTASYILTPLGTTSGLTFAVAPQVAPNGDLTYAAAANGNGTATFLIQVDDGGGTANGGIPISTPRTFTITVAAVNDPPTLGADSATVNWNTPANFIDVLANDSGAPDVGETVTVVGVTQGASGTVAIAPGGTGATYAPNVAFVGIDTFQYTASDGRGGLATATVTVTVIRPQTTAVDIVAIGTGPGTTGGSRVRILNAATGDFIAGFVAFDTSFNGGVNVATGDVNGDGVADVIVGAGATGGPRVIVVDGTKFGILGASNQIANPAALLANIFVYDFHFTGGVTVAAGDVNGDGKADLIVGTGVGGGPNVKVISGARINEVGPDNLPAPSAIIASFFAYSESFRGGVTVAAGDVNGDGFADVITGAGPGGGSHVKAFSGLTLFQRGAAAPGLVLASFFAYSPSFLGGVNVASGDLTGDGRAEIITGAGPGGGSHVKVYSPLNVVTPIASFFAFPAGFGGGVDVAFRRRSGGLAPLIVAGSGSGGAARVNAYAPPTFGSAGTFDAFDPSFLGGVAVG